MPYEELLVKRMRKDRVESRVCASASLHAWIRSSQNQGRTKQSPKVK